MLTHCNWMPEDEHTFYNYTSGTWLYNREARRSCNQMNAGCQLTLFAEFAVRRVKFNVDALISQCIKAGDATACTTFRKLAEGLMSLKRHSVCMLTRRLRNVQQAISRQARQWQGCHCSDSLSCGRTGTPHHCKRGGDTRIC